MSTSKGDQKGFPVRVKHRPRGYVSEITMNRIQFRFLPGYAITVNASQGRTLHSAVVCLEGDFKKNVKPYVMLSRLTNGTALGIIGSWRKKTFSLLPDPLMLSYLSKKLYPLEKRTRAAFNVGNIYAHERALRSLVKQ